MCKSKKFLQIYGRDFVGKTAYLVFFCVKILLKSTEQLKMSYL